MHPNLLNILLKKEIHSKKLSLVQKFARFLLDPSFRNKFMMVWILKVLALKNANVKSGLHVPLRWESKELWALSKKIWTFEPDELYLTL